MSRRQGALLARRLGILKVIEAEITTEIIETEAASRALVPRTNTKAGTETEIAIGIGIGMRIAQYRPLPHQTGDNVSAKYDFFFFWLFS
jgi:hypothetical protein